MSAPRTRERDIMGLDMTAANEAAFHGLARQLKQAGRSAKTTASYHQACLSLQRHLEHTGADTRLLNVTRDQASGWLIALQEAGGFSLDAAGAVVQAGAPMAKDSVVSYFGSARRFYNYAVAEELIEASPMAGMECPRPSGRPLDIPSLDLVGAMLDTCKPARGTKASFEDRRDEFVIRLFCETGGPRCSEVANLPAERCDFRNDLVLIEGKGGKWRRIAMCARTAQAGQRYARLREKHPDAGLPFMFLGRRGQLSSDGVYKIVARRSEMAGGHVHPHQLRHLAADLAKADEMTDGDLMQLFGWSTTKMLARYGAQHAADRALAASRRHAIGDRL